MTTTIQNLAQFEAQLDQGNQDLSGASLPGADLSGRALRGINLQGADLSGAVLSRANLAEANLKGVDLSGASLDRCELRKATLAHSNLSGAVLLKADMAWSDLKEVDLSGATLSGAHMHGAQAQGSNVSGGDLTQANLMGVRLDRVDLTDADLSGAQLQDAGLVHADLTGAQLRYADLSGADLTGARLEGVDFHSARTRGTTWTGAFYNAETRWPARFEAATSGAFGPQAQLAGAQLAGMFIRRADLTGADLTGADLTGADLTGADLTEANIADANLRDVRLYGATLSKVKGAAASLEGCRFDHQTVQASGWSEVDVAHWTEAGAVLTDPDREPDAQFKRTGLAIDLHPPLLPARERLVLGGLIIAVLGPHSDAHIASFETLQAEPSQEDSDGQVPQPQNDEEPPVRAWLQARRLEDLRALAEALHGDEVASHDFVSQALRAALDTLRKEQLSGMVLCGPRPDHPDPGPLQQWAARVASDDAQESELEAHGGVIEDHEEQ
ncbi:MAG: pentapeptide repeat-containing protein [Myxococcota bacterium]